MKPFRSLAALPLALALSCSNPDKAPAEAALKSAELTVNTLSDAAMRYAPEQKQALEQALAAAKALAEKKDYKGALAAANAIPEKAKQVLDAANVRKAQVTSWSEISYAVSQMATAINGRLDAIARTKPLPAGVTQGALDKAKADATGILAALETARAQASGGDLPGALTRATALRAQAVDVMKSVGMMP